jgi:hypothetical protein
MSAEDINKGQRWSIDIAEKLQQTNFGIICMTPENLSAPWVFFEAGALSKSMELSRVSPLLFGLKESDVERDSPVYQFQLTTFGKDEVFKLLQSINNASAEPDRLRDDVLKITFERSWMDLSKYIGEIDFKHATPPLPTDTSSNKMADILEELLSNSRAQLKILHAPNELLPRSHLRASFGVTTVSPPQYILLKRTINQLLQLVREMPEEEANRQTVESLVRRLEDQITGLRRGPFNMLLPLESPFDTDFFEEAWRLSREEVDSDESP